MSSPVEKRRLTRRLTNQRMADVFDQYLGSFHGDVYLTALDLFTRLSSLLRMSVHIDPRSSLMEATSLTDGTSRIRVGVQPGAITPRMKSRLMERFRLSDELLELPDAVFSPLIFGHEIGHVVQHDPTATDLFGPISYNNPTAVEDYPAYIESDSEANADYIAAVIVGNTEFGRMIDLMPPIEGPLEWRQWAAEHPVTNTIQTFGRLSIAAS